MKMPLDKEGDLREHSEAKVRLLSRYIVKYLAVVTNVPAFDQIDIYDLFSGPGLYGSESEGSPLVILRAALEVKAAVRARGKFCPKINLHFSDENPDHISRLTAEAYKLHDPNLGTLTVVQRTYSDALDELLSRPQNPRRKEFVFTDPLGYGDVKPKDIQRLMGRGAEVLLFQPTQFMYRFIATATPQVLADFVREIAGDSRFTPANDASGFAIQVRDLFRSYLGDGVFVSTFMIEKDQNTLFCLYFFTTKWQGQVRMVDAKWEVDPDDGRGWSFRQFPGQVSMIDPESFLEELIMSELANGTMTNIDLFKFGVLVHEFRSPFVTAACKSLKDTGRIKTTAVAGAKIKEGYFYIGDKYYKDKDLRLQIERI